MNYLVYDCEIVKCIPDRNNPNNPDLEYCEGWHDHAGMGVSVIGFYSSKVDRTDFVPGNALSYFEKLAARHDRIIGFNSRGFDDKLLTANGIGIRTHYDLLEEVRIAAGFEADYQSVPKGFSYSLDAIARANGAAKTGSGVLAPQLWQQGKFQEVIDYCLNDVRITHELLILGLEGRLKDPNTGASLQLKKID